MGILHASSHPNSDVDVLFAWRYSKVSLCWVDGRLFFYQPSCNDAAPKSLPRPFSALRAQDFMAVNLAHAQLRRRLVTASKMLAVTETIGKEGAERFLDSVITGVTPGKVRPRGEVNAARQE